MKQSYNTKQLGALLGCLEAHKSESLTVDGICDILSESGQTVGRTTVYRRLEQLVAEGKISRFAPEEGKSVTYRFIGSGCCEDCHFHLICTECGEISHTHCHELEALFAHINHENKTKEGEKNDHTRVRFFKKLFR